MVKPLALPTEKSTWIVNEFVKLHRKKKLIINKEYQRSEVWKRLKKQLLIDSIMNDYDIGSIILRRKGEKWEILDGQQRLKAIFDFVDSEFPLSKESDASLKGKSWDELDKEVQWGQFMVRQIYTTRIYSVDDETTSRIFLRVQEGMPLNAAEKLNAMTGIIRNSIVGLSEHPFLRQTKVSQFRFGHRYLCAQIALQETDGGVSNRDFKDAKFRNLKKMYEGYQNGLPTKVNDTIKATFNYLQKGLGNKAKVIREKSDLLSIYNLASYAIQHFVVKDREEQFGDFIVEFLSRVESADESDRDGYYDYWVARSSSPDSKKQIEKRFQIILEKFLTSEPNTKLKDEKRSFDWGQKLAIYAAANDQARKKGDKEARCKLCGKPTPVSKGEPDHIKAYNRGGLTTVKNGQWTCVSCNRAKNDKE